MERTEKEILADIVAAKEEYARLAQDDSSTQGEVKEAGALVIALVRELDEYVSRGAKPCTNPRLQSILIPDPEGPEGALIDTGETEMRPCGARPMGMLKTPAHMYMGNQLPNLWEVGCVYCAPFLVEREDGEALKIDGKVVKVKRRSFSARAFSPAEAVKKWNAGEWVEDTMFDRMRGFTPEYPDAAEV